MPSTGKLQKGDWVLVTGVTGLLGSSTANDLASRGLKVKAVTRQVGEKTRPLQEKLEKLYGKGVIEFVEVKNQSDPSVYKELVQGVAGVIHSSYDLTSLDPKQAVDTAANVMVGVLEAAKATPSVKAVVVTSSNVAAYWPSPNDGSISLDQYNDLAVKLAFELPDDDPTKFVAVYSATKVESERKLWQWVKENKPSFSINTILPHVLLGKPFNPAPGVYSTSSWLQWLFQGQVENNPGVAFWSSPAWSVHIKDAAAIHVGALIDEHTNGQRVWAAGNPPRGLNDMLAVFRGKYPNNDFVKDFDVAPPSKQDLDDTIGKGLLKKYTGRDYIGFEETILDTVEDVA